MYKTRRAMRDRISIQRIPTRKDSYNQTIELPGVDVLSNIPARFHSQAAMERMTGGQVRSQVSGFFEIRYTDQIDSAMQVKWGDEVYAIDAVENPLNETGTRQYTHIYVKKTD